MFVRKVTVQQEEKSEKSFQGQFKTLPLGLRIIIIFIAFGPFIGLLSAVFYQFSFSMHIVMFVITGSISWTMAHFLYKRVSWARKLLIVSSVLTIIWALFAFIPGLFMLGIGGSNPASSLGSALVFGGFFAILIFVINIPAIVISILVLWYMSRKHIKELFKKEKAAIQ